MRIRFHSMWAAVIAASFAMANQASADIILAGSFQGWDPPTGFVMTETFAGSGIYEHTLLGLSPGDNHEFKILEDLDNNPQWGDTELTPQNAWFTTDADGSILVRINTNAVIGDGYAPSTNRVGIESTAWLPQVVGNFMDEAGGGGDWNPSDSQFNMTDLGGGLFSYDAVISTAGTYDFKFTDGTGWARQFGSDGYNSNAGTYQFTTSFANQSVSFTFDAYNGYAFATTAVPEPSAIALLASLGCGLGMIRRRRG